MSFTNSQQALARWLHGIGAVSFGAFRLKLHETNPNAPLSPVYFNLRTSNNPKPGPLVQELVKAIGRELYLLARGRKLDFTTVGGIPNAGDPLADAFVAASGNQYPAPVRFGKMVDGDKRWVSDPITKNYVPGDIVLFIDDLVTHADTKLEAIKVARERLMTVNDMVVLIDREQGGAAELAKHNCRLHAVFPLTELLDFYVREEMVSEKLASEVLDYLKADS